MVRVERPPGPRGLSLYAGLLLRRDPTEAFCEFARRYPRLSHVRLGREHTYLLSHPDLITALFVTHGRSTRKGRALEKIRILLGDGLLTSEGTTHAEQRRLIQPALHDDQVGAYGQHMLDAARETGKRWQDGEQLDLAREMSALTLTVVGRALFGDRMERETAEVAECMGVLLGGFGRHLLPGADLLLSLPTPTNRRMLRAARRLDTLIRRMVAERQRDGQRPGDLLSVLVSRMDPERARDEAMTLLLAGHETTATALSWTWWLLDRHPNVARWWRSEVDAELDAGLDPSLDGVEQRLPRTRAVLAEAFRLYPPSWVLGRRLLAPVRLDDWTLPSGSLLVASQWAMHRDPRFWDRELSFRPCRWLTADGEFDESAPGQPRGAYFPFGLGSRLCVGRAFAWLEGVLLLAALGRDWAPRLVPETEVATLPAVTLRPRYGLPMTVHRR